MSNFFSLESPFYKFMSRLADMLKLNILWLFAGGVAEMFIIQLALAFSGLGAYQLISYIPLVMVGPATTAAFHITLKMVDEQEGYIAKAYKEAEKMLKLEKKQIPEDIDYDKVNNIASEARQKLKEVRPKTIAQAIRISGVNPADISILSVYLKKEYGKDE